MLNSSKSTKSIQRFACFVLASTLPCLSFAEEDWKFNTAINAMTGHYASSQTMDRQHGTGIRMAGEYKQVWGWSTSLQTTQIKMMPLMPSPTQDQQNWMLSGYVHTAMDQVPGHWRLQLDGYQIHNNDTVGNSDGVRVLAPLITWIAPTQALKVDAGYATSHYKGASPHHQLTYSLGFGFNQYRDWIELRGYSISQLNPNYALGQQNTRATDFKITHLLASAAPWVPHAITVNLERGKKIYFLDVPTQTVYNLPMMHEGGEKIATTWKLSSGSSLSLIASQTRYRAEQPATHHFKLKTLATQFEWSW